MYIAYGSLGEVASTIHHTHITLSPPIHPWPSPSAQIRDLYRKIDNILFIENRIGDQDLNIPSFTQIL
jgi:hypothetical protein